MRPIPHSDKVPVTIFTKLPDIDEDQLRSSTSSTNSDDNDEEQDIAHEAWNAGRVSLYSQSELNDLIRVLICQNNPLKCWLPDCRKNIFSKMVQVFFFIVTGKRN